MYSTPRSLSVFFTGFSDFLSYAIVLIPLHQSETLICPLVPLTDGC
jgi:hypothetical protein